MTHLPNVQLVSVEKSHQTGFSPLATPDPFLALNLGNCSLHLLSCFITFLGGGNSAPASSLLCITDTLALVVVCAQEAAPPVRLQLTVRFSNTISSLAPTVLEVVKASCYCWFVSNSTSLFLSPKVLPLHNLSISTL